MQSRQSTICSFCNSVMPLNRVDEHMANYHKNINYKLIATGQHRISLQGNFQGRPTQLPSHALRPLQPLPQTFNSTLSIPKIKTQNQLKKVRFQTPSQPLPLQNPQVILMDRQQVQQVDDFYTRRPPSYFVRHRQPTAPVQGVPRPYLQFTYKQVQSLSYYQQSRIKQLKLQKAQAKSTYQFQEPRYGVKLEQKSTQVSRAIPARQMNQLVQVTQESDRTVADSRLWQQEEVLISIPLKKLLDQLNHDYMTCDTCIGAVSNRSNCRRCNCGQVWAD